MTVGSVISLLVSFALILAGAMIFVNAIEWLGKKLDLAKGAVGSVLAAVGTALPETMIPVVALLSDGGEARTDIAIGAILGAPLLLATLAMGVTGVALWIFARRRGRKATLQVDKRLVRRDLRFFLFAYTFAILLAVLPIGDPKKYLWVLLVAIFGFFVYRAMTADDGGIDHDLDALHFAPRRNEPGLAIIVIQTIVALGLIVGGAHVFVGSVESISHALGIPALILALIIAPLATELPEKFNSVLWIGQEKDTLALGNITGAMVFQATIPVALGVALTDWVLSGVALFSALLALGAAAMFLIVFSGKREIGPASLILGGGLYALFVLYIIFLA